jgi:5'-methylthioadenosine nucleosidase
VDLAINAGTAGGFRAKGGAVGDVYVSSSLSHHDRRIPIPGFTEFGIGSHSSLAVPRLCAELGFKLGAVINPSCHHPT